MKIKTGLVGLGSHMISGIYGNLLKLPVKIEAVCDVSEEKIMDFRDLCPVPLEKCYQSYEEMLEREKPDAVLCVGNARLHYEVAVSCLKRGIPVFVEKTPCLNAAQAEYLAGLEREHGCFGMAGFNRRFATAYRLMKQIIEEDDFGRPCMYMAKYNSSQYPEEDYFVFNHVIHHLDLIRYLGGEVKELQADKIVLSDRQTGYHIRFVTESGMMGFLQSSSLQCEAYPVERVEITGEGTCVTVDQVKRLQYNKRTDPKTDLEPFFSKQKDGLNWNYNQGHSSLYGHYGFERELAHFFCAVAEGRRPEYTFSDMTGTMKLYEELKKHTKEV